MSADEAFIKAVEFAEIVFDNIFEHAVYKAKAQNIVDKAIDYAE